MPSVIDERQAERLQYIDLCAYVLGAVNRNVLMNRFEIKQVLPPATSPPIRRCQVRTSPTIWP